MLSSGAACYNLCLAANALGYGTNWVTEWYTYNEDVRRALECDDRDNIAGFIYIGTAAEKSEERERPELSKIVNAWADGFAPQKGDDFEKPDMGMPVKGFKNY